ncbi:MAG: hypothetical protein QOF57_1445 [Frankiaceae bacterium]|nr:hypothetical protein [Frankiaceae bacterium]
MQTRRIVLAAVAVASLLVSGQAFAVDRQVTSPSVTVVASNLNNPRGLTWARGHLYVAEAGRGGTDCPAGAMGPEGGPLCVGRTGALSVIRDGRAEHVLSDLFSQSDIPGGIAALGIAAVAATKSGDLRVLFSESVAGFTAGLPENATLTDANTEAAGSQLGMLKKVVGHDTHLLASVGDADYLWTALHRNLVPDQFPDSNPNAMAIVGDKTYVIDAGANTLVEVDRQGVVRERAFFPNPPAADAVPTCIAVGPDGNFYIGQLAPGAPLNTGNIYKYEPRSRSLHVWKTGFNVVDGCGFDKAGNFYAVEFQANGFNPGPTGNPAGDVIKITPNGTRTVLGAGKLFFPQGFATDEAGNIYVSNWSIMTGTPAGPGAPTGQVVRITQ